MGSLARPRGSIIGSAVLFAAVVAVAFAAAPAPVASAGTLSQWNFNSTTAPFAPVVGSGTTGGYGQSSPAAPVSTIIINGASTDPGTVISGTTFNRSDVINPPLVSTANNSTGVWFQAPTTGMAVGQAVKLSWSQTVGYRSSRYWQVLVSSTGGTAGYVIPSGGTGSSISTVVNGLNSGTAAISGTASASVNSGGLIDFRTINNNSLVPAVTASGTLTAQNFAAGFVDDISFTLPTGLGYENNANFAFAIVGAFDPAYGGSSGTNGYKSSYAGTDSTDAVNGYNRSLAIGGSMRLDLVTVSSVAVVPEPSAIALAGIGIGFGLWKFGRRRGPVFADASTAGQ
jgi:hypothetical protein